MTVEGELQEVMENLGGCGFAFGGDCGEQECGTDGLSKGSLFSCKLCGPVLSTGPEGAGREGAVLFCVFVSLESGTVPSI